MWCLPKGISTRFRFGRFCKEEGFLKNIRTKIEEGTTGQILEFYNDYAINGTLFSFPWVIDYDQKLSSSLSAQNLDCQITSSAANTLTATIVQEVPGYR